MPQAVTHILVPILLMSLIRDKILKINTKKHFPLHYVFIAGIGGVLPDIDIVISVILKLFSVSNWWIHKTFTHSLFFPLIFLLLALVFMPMHAKAKICNLGRHKMKLSIIFLMLSIGTLIHIFLDLLAGESAFLFYPFLIQDYGINLFSLLPFEWSITAALIDGILLVLWISYLEFKHRISDFI